MATPEKMLDIAAIRRRQQELDLSDRALQRALALGGVNVHSLLHGQSERMLTLGGLARLADALGVDVHDLLLDPRDCHTHVATATPDEPPRAATQDATPHARPSANQQQNPTDSADQPARADCETLGAAMLVRQGKTPATVAELCHALGWTPEQLQRARHELQARLDPTGMQVVQHADQIRLAGTDLHDDVTRRLSTQAASRPSGLTMAACRQLIEIIEKPPLDKQTRLIPRRAHTTELSSMGLIDLVTGGPGPDVTAALLLEEIPVVPSPNFRIDPGPEDAGQVSTPPESVTPASPAPRPPSSRAASHHTKTGGTT